MNLLKEFVNCIKLKAVKNGLVSFCFLIFLLASSKVSPNYHFSFIKIQPTYEPEDVINVIYQNNTIIFKGINVNGNLKIYSIIGNKIMDMNIQDFSKIIIPINLDRQNIYIIRIETSDNRIFTHKIVAH